MRILKNHAEAGCIGAGLFFVLFPAALVLGVAPADAAASEPAERCAPLKEAPPASISEKVRQVLASEALRILAPDGKPLVDIWLRTSIPTKEDPKALGIYYGALPEGSLLGAMRFHRKADDFRGDGFRSAVYTFRYALQPEDGDHLGVSDARDFVLLCPVNLDVEPAPMPTKEVVKLSIKASGRKHPSVLFLTKVFDKAEKLPRFVEEKDRRLWIFDCEIPNADKGKAAVRLGIVLLGLAEGF